MKRLLCFLVLASSLSGCATVEVGPYGKTYVPCVDNKLCVRDTYSIAWDNGCRNNCQDYPISYRSKQTEYMLVPATTKPCDGECGGAR